MSNEMVAGNFYDNIDNPMEAMKTIGDVMVKSGMFGCSKMEQGAVLAMACICEKKNPLEIARTYHIVEGKLSKKYEAMIAEFFAMGGKIEWIERTDEAVEAKFTHPKNGSYTLRITMDDVKACGVALANNGQIKDNYKKFPRQMLTARVVSECMRLIAPSVVCGVYTPEEISDFKENSTVEISSSPKMAKPEPKVEVVKEVVKEVVAEVVVEEPVKRTRKKRGPNKPKPVVETVVEPTVDPLAEALANDDDNTIIELNPIESEVNAYLLGIGWLSEGQRYTDLAAEHMVMLKANLDNFIVKVKEISNAS